MNAEITMAIAQFVPVWRFNWWATCRSMALKFFRIKCAVAKDLAKTVKQMIEEEPEGDRIWKVHLNVADLHSFL